MNRRSLFGFRIARRICASSAATLLAALIIAPMPARAAVSIVSGATVVTFDTLPAAADWSTGSVAGAAGGVGDTTTAAGLDAAVAAVLASGITAQLGNTGVNPPAFNALAQFNSVALNVQTRPTGNRFTELMVTLQNNTGSAVSSLALSYNFGVNSPLAESPGLWGHRVYFSLTGLANSWTNVAAFNLADNAPAAVLSGSLSLGNWASGATMFVLWADDNGPSSPDTGFTLDNVSFTPTLLGKNLIYNLGHVVGGAPNGSLTTGGGNYWLDGATPAAFSTNDRITFSQDGSATIDVPAPGVTAGSMTVSHASGTYTIGGAGAITSTFTKSNAGSLVLTSANSFTVPTITGGTVETQATNALGTGAITISGGATLKTTTVAQVQGAAVSIGSGGATIQTDTDLSIAGINGTGALTKKGAGALTLAGGSSSASVAGLIIQAGKVSANATASLGGATQSISLDGGTLEMTNTFDQTFTGTLSTTANGGTISVTGTASADGLIIGTANSVTGSGTITKTGAGILRMIANQTTLSSNWIVNGGVLSFGNATTSSVGSGTVTVNAGGRFGGVNTAVPNNITLNGGGLATRSGNATNFQGTVNVTASSTANMLSFNSFGANDITVSGVLSGAGDLTLNGNAGNNGAQALILTNTGNTYSGTFRVSAAQTLTSQPAAGVGSTLDSRPVVLSTATLRIRDNGAGSNGTLAYGSNVTVDSGNSAIDVDRAAGGATTGNTVVLGSLSIGAQILTTTGANGYGVRFGATTLTGAATFNPTTATTTLGGVVSGGFSLTKTGAATLVLAGTNTYGGGTIIDGGTLNIDGDAALGGAAGGVTIDNNAILQAAAPVTSARAFTLGAGGGTIDTNGPAVTLGGSIGGTTLTKTGTGTLTLAGGQTYTTLNANGGLTNVNTALGTGTSTLNAGATVHINASQTLAALNIAAGVEVTFGAGGALTGEPEKTGAAALVPEPGAMGLLLAGGLGFLARRRRSQSLC